MTNRVVIVLGLLMASVAAGCTQEDYYCDASGCYYCDGTGCRPVAPPGRSACGCDRDCGTGSVCTALGCTVTCGASGSGTACPHGTVCTGGFCAGPTETAPTAQIECVCDPTVATSCDRFAHAGETLACVCPPGGTCACVIQGGRVDCSTDPSLCPVEYTCVAGECRPPTAVCRYDSQCATGQRCENSACVLPCAAGTCATGSSCGADGFCHADPPPTCSAATPCATGTCINGECRVMCTADSMCPTGHYCGEDQLCHFDDRPTSHCPCTGPGAVCAAGVCRSPCSNATDCRRFDEQLTFCGPDMLCYTTSESTSNCAVQQDCAAGQNCLGGVCQ